MIKDCKIIQFERIGNDVGNLTFIESINHLPFNIKRVYYISEIPCGAKRGAHAHRALHQIIIALSGSFDIELDDGKDKKKITLSKNDQGLYVCPMIWRDIDNFSDNSVCLVLASEYYDELDYYRDYDKFIKDT
jgi:dTDP-4-dehydrorhamnose 3,5-epimerase-like enzyme